MKILAGIACLFGTFSMPMMTADVNAVESNNAEVTTVSVESSETSSVLELPSSSEEEKIVYTYSDEGGSYTFTLIDDKKATIEGVSPKGTVMKLTCDYVIENNIISFYIDGELWSQFTIKEDKTLEIYEEPTPDEPIVVEPVNLEEEISNLQALVEALKKELESETFNAENLAKIIVAMGGTLGSILLVLLYKILRTKIRNLKNDEEYQKAKKAMEEEFAKYQAEVKELINSLESKVVKKIDDTEEKRQIEIEAQSIQLSEKVEKAKKNLSIDEILNEE